MKNSAHNSLLHAIRNSGVIAGALSMLAVFAILTPQPAHGQAGYYTQNGGVVWYGAQQQRGHHPAAAYYPAPGYIQHPAYSQPAVRGGYPPGSYPAAASPYGGTTAWAQPGYVAQPYQQNSAYGVPQQPYGYSQQAAPTSGYGQPFVQQQRQQYAQRNAYPAYGYGYPVTGYPSYSTPPPGHPAYGQPGQYPQHGNPQQGQPQQAQPQQPNQQQSNQQVHNQLTPVQQAAQQAAINISPNGVPVLSPAASKFFRNLQGPNRSTYNQNRQNYSYSGQTRPSNQIPNTTWQSGSRFGQTYSHRNNHNQTTVNQNRFNYSLRNLTRPGLRGY
jgi:hypothetical protein